MNITQKLLGIDYGEKRVGIASTDESGQYALPREVLTNTPELVNQVVRFAEENEIKKVIIGESKDFKGKSNPIQKKILEFKKELENRGLEAVLHPEVLSTMEARQIQGGGRMTDASAAAIILKNYIDSQAN